METLFKIERLRLNIKQSEVSKICEVSLKTVINWEKGTHSIPSTKLTTLAEMGFDVQYLITGKRCYTTGDTILDQITKEQLLDTLEIMLKKNEQQANEMKCAIEKVKKL